MASTQHQHRPVLVFCASGRTGTATIERLLENQPDTTIFGFIREEHKAKDRLPDTVHKIFGDITNKSDLLGAFEAAGSNARVFIISGAYPDMGCIEGQIAQLAVERKAAQIVKLSVYGANFNEGRDSVNRWHAEAERAIETAVKGSIPTTMLRANIFFQNSIKSYAESIKRERRLPCPSGDIVLSSVDLRDVAVAAAVVLSEDPSKHANHTYYLTGPQSLTAADYCQAFSEGLGTKVDLALLDDTDMFHHLSNTMSDLHTTMLLKFFQACRFGIAAPVQGDFKLLTGREPRNMQQFVQDYSDKFQ